MKQGIVDQDDAARPNPRREKPEVAIIVLFVAVDEDKIIARAEADDFPLQVEGIPLQQTDPGAETIDTKIAPRECSDGGEFLDRQDLAPSWKIPSQTHSGEPDERADFQNPAGPDQADKDFQPAQHDWVRSHLLLADATTLGEAIVFFRTGNSGKAGACCKEGLGQSGCPAPVKVGKRPLIRKNFIVIADGHKPYP